MSHDANAQCACVTEHRPPVLELNRHHIWPLEHGGPDVEENLIWICPTTHANVHEILRMLIKRAAPLTYFEVQQVSDRPVSRYAYNLALQGWFAIVLERVPA